MAVYDYGKTFDKLNSSRVLSNPITPCVAKIFKRAYWSEVMR
jgi:hypothetical protein